MIGNRVFRKQNYLRRKQPFANLFVPIEDDVIHSVDYLVIGIVNCLISYSRMVIQIYIYIHTQYS